MDTLSQLVRMLDPYGTVDLRCRFAGEWAVPHDQVRAGAVPYHVVLSGSCLAMVGLQEMTLGPGDILIIPRGAPHTIRSIRRPGDADAPAPRPTQRKFNGVVTNVSQPGQGEVLDLLCGEFLFDGAASVLLQTLPEMGLVNSRTRADCQGLESLIAMMRMETEAGSHGSAALVGELSTALFIIILRALIDDESNEGILAVLSDRRLSKALGAVLRDPGHDWTVESLAAQCNLSRSSFARQFAGVAKVTPLEIVTAIRMEAAAKMLTRDKMAVGLAAERCGYASEAAFSRKFKDYFGVGPGEYRRLGDGSGR